MMSQSRRRTLPLLSGNTKGRPRRPDWKNLRPRLEGLEDRTLLASADLALVKTGPALAIAGSTITYTLTATNNGPDTAADFTLVDTLTGPASFATGLVHVSGPVASVDPLPVGQTAVYTVAVNVSAAATVGSIVHDDGNISSTTPDPNTGNNTPAVDTAVVLGADLAVSKVGPATVTAGTSATYTITLTNNGPDAAQNVQLSDLLSPGLVLDSLTLPPGFAASVTTSSFTATTATVASGEVDHFILVAHAPSSDAAGSTASDTATATSDTPDPNGNNNSATFASTVQTSADLVMVKTGPATAVAGSTITYTLTISNNGPSNGQLTILSDSILGGLLGNFHHVSGPDLGAALPPGQTSVFTLPVQIPANAASGSVVHDTASISSTTPDPNSTNNSSSINTTVFTQADLSVSKTGSPNPVLLGSNITFTLNVANSGPSDAQNVVLSDALPAGTVFVSEQQSSGPAFALGHPNVGVNGTISNTIATLAAGASASFQIVVQTQSRALAQTTVVNTATITSTTTDPNTGNNSSTTSTQVFDQADLAVTKVGPATVISGNNLTYTLTVANNGPIFDPNVVLTDAVPANTSFVSETQTSGPAFSCSTPAFGGTGTISCSLASMAAGASATFVIVVHVGPLTPNNSDIVNSAHFTGSLFDPNTANNTATVHTTAITPTADLVLTGSVQPTTLKTGGTGPLVYSFTVTNLGPDPSLSVVLDEGLPSQVTFAGETHPAGWTAFDPPVGSHNDVLFTIGSLAPGATATFTVVAKAPPLPAGTRLINTAALTSSTFDPVISNNVVVIITPVK